MAYGFVPVKYLDGTPYNGGLQRAYLDSGAGVGIFEGDVLGIADAEDANTSDAYHHVTIGSKDTGVINIGVAKYFEYTDGEGNFFQTNTVSSTLVAAATTDALKISVYYTPIGRDLMFKCIADDDTDALTAIDMNANFDAINGAGVAKTGLSGWMLDSNTEATTSGTPLRLWGLYNKPGNTWGNTAGTVEVLVTFNDTALRTGVAGLT